MAEDLNPDGDRTLGILTKPDLVDKGAERDVIDLIEDRRHKLKLGWHLLRNPGQADVCDSPSARSSIEDEFFKTIKPWNALDKDKVGVQSLRRRLQEILATHIRREFLKVRERNNCYNVANFFKVKLEISQKLQASQMRLQSLGPKRQTQSEHMQFLIDIAIRFQNIASAAARVDYGLVAFFEKDKNFRLATAAVNRGAAFVDAMAKWGHRFNFCGSNQTLEAVPDEDFSELSIGEEDPIIVRLVPDYPDICDLLPKDATIPKPNGSDILAWLKTVYGESRGFELGTFASSILAVTMQK